MDAYRNRIAGVIFAAAGAAAASGPSLAASKLLKAMPMPTPFSLVLTCRLGSGGDVAPVYIRNSTDSRIEANEPISWQTSAGAHGVVKVPFPLDPGKELRIASAPPAPACSAWVKRVPMLQQVPAQ